MTEGLSGGIARAFAVDGGGETVILASEHERLSHMGVSGAVSAAYDIMTDSGMTPENSAKLAAAAERGGKDPEEFARHVARLRAALKP